MRAVGIVLGAAILLAPALPASAQTLGAVFHQVNAAVVVIRAKGRDVAPGSGAVRFSEIGSGVLVSADGNVMTAAHVVHAMDEITVEFIGGDTVAAQVIASEPAADLSLLKLERVPAGAAVAALANSDTVKIGDQVIVIGAPYGLRHSMTAGDLLNLPPGTVGYLVKTVAKGSPGEAVGLRGGTTLAVIDGEPIVLGGDIILRVQGISVRGLANYERIRMLLAQLPSGGAFTVSVLRAGRVLELTGRKP